MTAKKAQTGAKQKKIRLNGARKGEIRQAFDRSLKSAREAGRLQDAGVLVATCERLATAADAAWRADDFTAFNQATTKLARLIVSLGLEQFPVEGGVDGDGEGSADGVGEPDAIQRELDRIMGSGPALGNR